MLYRTFFEPCLFLSRIVYVVLGQISFQGTYLYDYMLVVNEVIHTMAHFHRISNTDSIMMRQEVAAATALL